MSFKINQDYLRSIVFGCQDALVSTTGIVIGISAAVSNRQFIVLSALVTVSVEALSMAAGQYLSEKSVHDLSNNRHRDNLALGSLFMFISYLVGGFIPIIPILIFPINISPLITTLFSFIGLFALGFLKAKFFANHPWRSAIEMLVIGGLATLIGLLVGFTLKTY